MLLGYAKVYCKPMECKEIHHPEKGLVQTWTESYAISDNGVPPCDIKQPIKNK